MNRSAASITALAIVAVLFALAPGDLALVDDFEDDYWLPFTHVNLGNGASAGYSSSVARSGARSYHVEIHGWQTRDFGSAYGYAAYATRGSPLAELRMSLLFDRLEDTARSPRDGFVAGVSLELLDARYRSVSAMTYVVASAGSHHAVGCGHSAKHLLFAGSPAVSTWLDFGRNPAADFPRAPWKSAEYVRVAVGFLCGTGLTGASYSMYFDDFMMATGAGDSDADAIGDLEEETRIYASRLQGPDTAIEIPSAGVAEARVDGPALSGVLTSTALAVEIDHGRPTDLSVTGEFFDGSAWRSQLLWDPGFHARGAAIFSPTYGQSVRGLVLVSGRISENVPGSSVHLFVDDHWEGVGERAADNSFEVPWVTRGWSEGPHALRVVVAQDGDPGSRGVSSPASPIVLDGTPPGVAIASPTAGSILQGLSTIEVHAFDEQALDGVELRFDGTVVGALEQEPFAFLYDTRDLPNGAHTLEVRARDTAGNEASQSIGVRFDNRGTYVLPKCKPACKLASIGAVGNLAPPTINPVARALRLASGDSLLLWETFQIPWRPGVSWSVNGVSLVADVQQDQVVAAGDGLIGSGWDAADLARAQSWRIRVRDHGFGDGGLIRSFAVLGGSRTSPGSPDTDADGLPDGTERLVSQTSPVHADSDGDGIADGIELSPRSIGFLIDGLRVDRLVATNPLD
ncbi:MAG TPA: Ig-like domain-containing protein, partial [Thermoplasmata archaeon]|nr:Ig-like domain-containing protein [Thermoplasmata archaeon]